MMPIRSLLSMAEHHARTSSAGKLYPAAASITTLRQASSS